MNEVLERVERLCWSEAMREVLSPLFKGNLFSCCLSFWICGAFLVQAAVPETALYLDLLENNQEFIVSLLESWQKHGRKCPGRS